MTKAEQHPPSDGQGKGDYVTAVQYTGKNTILLMSDEQPWPLNVHW